MQQAFVFTCGRNSPNFPPGLHFVEPQVRDHAHDPPCHCALCKPHVVAEVRFINKLFEVEA
jgi:hypothetical protein